MKKDREKFLSSIYVIIKNEDNKILLQRRQGTKFCSGYLALPAGHLDVGENVYDALIREAKEELDIDISINDIVLIFSLTYLWMDKWHIHNEYATCFLL